MKQTSKKTKKLPKFSPDDDGSNANNDDNGIKP